MRWAALLLAVLLTAAGAVGQESASPHHMTTPDGKIDTDKCPLCHEPDMMTLSRSKVETCTLCHSPHPHAGAAEHLAATPERVARQLATSGANAPSWPLTDDGHIYCGTCHLFHDPAVSTDAWLPSGWVPDSTGLPEAVHRALAAQWEQTEHKYDEASTAARFATSGTRQLRLPVSDGTLCRRCHGSWQ